MQVAKNNNPAGEKAVHCAITLNVREGKEAEFEEVLLRFVQLSLDYRGTTGVHLIRPAPESGSREFGILRSSSLRSWLYSL